MREIVLRNDTDFEGWRRQARNCISEGISPSDICFRTQAQLGDLFGSGEETHVNPSPHKSFDVPRAFIELASIAILHRDAARFELLYELLWRIKREKQVLSVSVDPLVARLRAMEKSVRRDEHKMHAFVRFREIHGESGPHFIAWFEPEHHIAELAAPFFLRRFSNMRWSILTLDICVHWDREILSQSPGLSRDAAPKDDAAEDLWRTYYQNIFNPARLKVKAMRKEMPQKYWKNLPEAHLIKPLIASAAKITQQMIEAGPAAPRPNPQRLVGTEMQASATAKTTIEIMRQQASECRVCPLWQPATQTVFGEGPIDAGVMLVGEQPGDKEDLAGQPFVGPAGEMLNRALADAGIERQKTYVTNAVKHFKFLPRGKIRLHQKPQTSEISSCRPWLTREIAVVKPRMIVTLGATAAQSLFGRAMVIGKSRGQVLTLGDTRAIVTVHPSFLLRLPDERSRDAQYALFVEDLRLAAPYAKLA